MIRLDLMVYRIELLADPLSSVISNALRKSNICGMRMNRRTFYRIKDIRCLAQIYVNIHIPELGKVSVESERHEEAGVLRLRVRLGGVERTVERDPGGVHLLACHQVYAVTIWHIYTGLGDKIFLFKLLIQFLLLKSIFLLPPSYIFTN